MFVFFQLLNVDVFTDITDSCVMKKARSMNHFFHSSAISVCVQLFLERLSEEMGTRQSRNVIWDMINTLFVTTEAVEPTVVVFL